MYLVGRYFIWHDSDREKLRQLLGQSLYPHVSKYEKPKERTPKKTPLIKTTLVPKGIEFDVMYWRKANAIHKWFVDNVQEGKDDCGTYYVSEEQIRALLHTVTKALESKDYEKRLPTQSGFFFGSTEYDEYYVKDLQDTKDGLEKFLNSEEAKDLSLYYHSSW